jgi:glycine dehydrogenase subunit 1
MSLLGPEGLSRAAAHSVANTQALVAELTSIPGVRLAFTGERFHEAVIRLTKDPDAVLAKLAEAGILGGYALGRDYPELADALLVCATETRTAEDIARYASTLNSILEH